MAGLNTDRTRYLGISLLGTKLTTASINTIGNAARVISWFDADNAGTKARADLYKAVSMFTSVVSIRSERDPKRYSDQDIRQYVKAALDAKQSE
jgi:DNA primase